jgi:hypothetical protein
LYSKQKATMNSVLADILARTRRTLEGAGVPVVEQWHLDFDHAVTVKAISDKQIEVRDFFVPMCILDITLVGDRPRLSCYNADFTPHNLRFGRDAILAKRQTVQRILTDFAKEFDPFERRKYLAAVFYHSRYETARRRAEARALSRIALEEMLEARRNKLVDGTV